MRIAIVGLGKFGSVLAAVCADSGHQTVGTDLNTYPVDLINRGVAPFTEPGLQKLLGGSQGRLSATVDARKAIQASDATFVVVPTPSQAEGEFSNDFVNAALEEIGRALKHVESPHTVIICSTVSPGSCMDELVPILETSSGKKVGDSLGFVYSPQFIALGSVIRNLRNPDMVLIGASDDWAAGVAHKIWRSVAVNEPSWQRMSLPSAEIVKLAVNAFVTMKISFANMLGEICEQVPGADIDAVTNAVGADSRIGRKYMKGALGYGGPCFPRDNRALEAFASRIGIDAPLPRATDHINDRQVERVVRKLASKLPVPSRVAVLGLAYKPDTAVCEASQGVEIANQLQAMGYLVSVHDPQAVDTAAAELRPGISLCRKVEDALESSQAVIISTAWDDYRSIRSESLNSKLVIDPWSVLGHASGESP